MAAGYWPEGYWPIGFWSVGYWPETAIIPPITTDDHVWLGHTDISDRFTGTRIGDSIQSSRIVRSLTGSRPR